MSENMFEFKETGGEYILASYNENDDRSEITIPAEHERKPVTAIGEAAFGHSKYLQRVTVSEGIKRLDKFAFHTSPRLRFVSLPSSLETLGRGAFCSCGELCEVEFKSCPEFGSDVFDKDLKLPAELFLAGLVRSRDITRPLDEKMLRSEIEYANYALQYDCELDFTPWLCRPDIFTLAAQNDCFREIGAELLDDLVDYCARNNQPEHTAYFLDLKRRKFGFSGDDLEL